MDDWGLMNARVLRRDATQGAIFLLEGTFR